MFILSNIGTHYQLWTIGTRRWGFITESTYNYLLLFQDTLEHSTAYFRGGVELILYQLSRGCPKAMFNSNSILTVRKEEGDAEERGLDDGEDVDIVRRRE